jgi:PilZ domain
MKFDNVLKWRAMADNLAAEIERRGRRRFTVNAPVTLFIGNREISAYTRDLSNLGAYFYLSISDSMQIESEFDFTIELPPEMTITPYCCIRGRGRAVRTENAESNLAGMGAEILEYSIVSNPA